MIPVWDPIFYSLQRIFRHVQRIFRHVQRVIRRIQRFLSQPFFVAEQFTGAEGRYVSMEDTISGFEAILNGEADKLPESAFMYVGSIDEAFDRAK